MSPVVTCESNNIVTCGDGVTLPLPVEDSRESRSATQELPLYLKSAGGTWLVLEGALCSTDPPRMPGHFRIP